MAESAAREHLRAGSQRDRGAAADARRFAQAIPTTRTCHECLSEGHEANAQYCKDCGAKLPPHQRD